MNLPSAAMPWGRWLADLQEGTQRRVDIQKNDPNSPGRLFGAQADVLASQLTGINVATIREIPLPNFSQGVSGALGTAVNVVSSVYSSSPPQGRSISCLAILNFRITSSSGNAPNTPMMKVNGQMFSDLGASALRPPADASQGYYSVMGNVPLVAGQAVDFQYGASIAANPTVNTLTFDEATAWLAFYGGV